jgi:hypothetical protein
MVFGAVFSWNGSRARKPLHKGKFDFNIRTWYAHLLLYVTGERVGVYGRFTRVLCVLCSYGFVCNNRVCERYGSYARRQPIVNVHGSRCLTWFLFFPPKSSALNIIRVWWLFDPRIRCTYDLISNERVRQTHIQM